MTSVKPWWWSDDQENYKGPFDSRDAAISDAYCYRAECFDDPEKAEGFYVLQAAQRANPEYEPELGYYSDGNFQFFLDGKAEHVTALTVTDMFHDTWVKSIKEPA